jgi:hypothetical protein
MLIVLPLPETKVTETEAQREIRGYREQDAAIRKARRRARLTAPFSAVLTLMHFISSQICKRAAALAAALGDARNARRKTSERQAPQI